MSQVKPEVKNAKPSSVVDDDDDDWKELVTDVDGFWNEETADTVQGKVVSITQMELAKRDTMVAVITLTKPIDAVKGSKEDKEIVSLKPGQAIGVVIKHKLQDLPSMADNQCEVRIQAREKITLDNGNTMWRYSVKFRGSRSPVAALGTQTQARPPAQAQSSKAGSTKTTGPEENF